MVTMARTARPYRPCVSSCMVLPGSSSAPVRRVPPGPPESGAADTARSAGSKIAEAPHTRPGTRPGLALCAPAPRRQPRAPRCNTTGRCCRRQLVVITAADELQPALTADRHAALILPHRPAADAARDRQAKGRLHGINISSAPASGGRQLANAGPARSCPARPCRRPGRPADLGRHEEAALRSIQVTTAYSQDSTASLAKPTPPGGIRAGNPVGPDQT